VSRRERPAKPALTWQAIIDAALVILQDEGLDKVTMRRSPGLDTGQHRYTPMSITRGPARADPRRAAGRAPPFGGRARHVA